MRGTILCRAVLRSLGGRVMRKLLALFAAFLTGLAVTACDKRPDYWEAYIYPAGDDESQAFRIDGFVSFETCQRAAIQQLRRLNATETGWYECGYKCGPQSGYGDLRICKETRD